MKLTYLKNYSNNIIKEYSVITSDADAKASSLSGGNLHFFFKPLIYTALFNQKKRSIIFKTQLMSDKLAMTLSSA